MREGPVLRKGDLEYQPDLVTRAPIRTNFSFLLLPLYRTQLLHSRCTCQQERKRTLMSLIAFLEVCDPFTENIEKKNATLISQLIPVSLHMGRVDNGDVCHSPPRIHTHIRTLTGIEMIYSQIQRRTRRQRNSFYLILLPSV